MWSPTSGRPRFGGGCGRPIAAITQVGPTGNPVDFTGCTLFEFAGGRVVRLTVYIDAATLMRQVAAKP